MTLVDKIFTGMGILVVLIFGVGVFYFGRCSVRPAESETRVIKQAPTFTMEGPLVTLGRGHTVVVEKTKRVVEWKTVVKEAPGNTCQKYLGSVTPSCPDCVQTVISPQKRVTFNRLDGFIGYGAIGNESGLVRLGYGVEVTYQPVCVNGARLSGCLAAKMGADLSQAGKVLDARALVGIGVGWR